MKGRNAQPATAAAAGNGGLKRPAAGQRLPDGRIAQRPSSPEDAHVDLLAAVVRDAHKQAAGFGSEAVEAVGWLCAFGGDLWIQAISDRRSEWR